MADPNDLRIRITATDDTRGTVDRVRQGVDSVANSSGRASENMRRLGGSAGQAANAVRQLPAQFSDILVSLQGGQQVFTVLLQQGSQIRDSFGGVGEALSGIVEFTSKLVNPATLAATAIAGLGAAFLAGREQSKAMVRAIELSGNFAGTTASQLNELSESIGATGAVSISSAREITNALVTTGQVGQKALRPMAEAAAEYSRVMGEASGKSSEFIAKTFADPAKGAGELNKQFNFLTIALYKQIKAQQEAGDMAGAQATASEALRAKLAGVGKDLGYVESAWKGLGVAASQAWNFMLGVGRDDTLSERLAALPKVIKGIEEEIQIERGFAGGQSSAAVASLEKMLALKRAELATTIKAAQAEKEKAVAAAKTAKEVQAAVAEDQEKDKSGGKSGKNDAYRAELLEMDGLQQRQRELLSSQLAALASLRKRGEISELQSIDRVLVAQRKALEEEREIAQKKLALAQKEGRKGDAQKASSEVESIQRKLDEAARAAEDRRLEVAKSNSDLILKIRVDSLKAGGNIVAAAAADFDRQYSQKIADAIKDGNTELQEALRGLRETTLASAGFDEAKAQFAAALAEMQQGIEGVRTAAGDGLSFAEALGIQASENEIRNRYIPVLKALQAELARLASLSGNADQRKAAADFGKEISKQTAELNPEWKKTVDRFEQTFREGFVGMLRDGKGSFSSWTKSLRDTFKTEVANYIYKEFAKPFVVNVLANLIGTSGSSTAGGGASGGQGGGIPSIPSFGGSLGGLANSFAMSGVGQSLGLSTANAFGANSALAAQYGAFSEVTAGLTSAGTAFTTAASAIGQALPYIGAAVAVFSYFKSKEGGPKSGGFARQDFDPTGKASDSAITSRLFTPNQSDPEVLKAIQATGASFNAQLKALGGKGGATFGLGFDTDPKGDAPNRISGEAFVDGKTVYSNRDRDIGRDNEKIGEELGKETQRMLLAAVKASELPAEIATILSDGIPDAMAASSEQIATILGDAQFWKKAFLDTPQAIAAVFGESISLDEFKSVQVAGESLQRTFERLAPVFTVTNDVAALAGKTYEETFGVIGIATADARQQLVDFAGGVDKLANSLGAYFENFFSPQEKAAIKARQLAESFSLVGEAVPESREAFAALIEAQDRTTESGRRHYAELVALSAAYIENENASKAAAEAVQASARTFGLSAEAISSALSGALSQSGNAEGAGKAFATTVVNGIETALVADANARIVGVVTSGLVTPIINAVTAGTSIAAVLSDAALNDMVGKASGIASAMSALFADETFRASLKKIGDALKPIGEAAFDSLKTLETATKAAGLSFDTIKSNLLSSVQDASGATEAGDNFAASIVGSIESALLDNAAGQITQIVTDGLVTPIIEAVLAGTSITEAISEAAIDDMIAKAKGVATALNIILNDPEFKAALSQIGASLKPVGASLYVAAPRKITPASDRDTGSEDKADTLRPVADYIKTLDRQIADLAPGQTEYAKQLRAIRLAADDAVEGLKEYSGDLTTAKEKIGQLQKAQEDQLAAQNKADIASITDGLQEALDKNGLTDVAAALYDIDGQYKRQLESLTAVNGATAENIALLDKFRDQQKTDALKAQQNREDQQQISLLQAQGNAYDALALQRKLEIEQIKQTSGAKAAAIQQQIYDEQEKSRLSGLALRFSDDPVKQAFKKLTTQYGDFGSLDGLLAQGPDKLREMVSGYIATLDPLTESGQRGAVALEGVADSIDLIISTAQAAIDAQKSFVEKYRTGTPESALLKIKAAPGFGGLGSLAEIIGLGPETLKTMLADYGSSLNSSTEDGRRAISVLGELSGAFDTVIGSAEAAKEATRKFYSDQLSGALDGLKKAVDVEKDALRKTYDDQVAKTKASIDGLTKSVGNLESLSSALKNTLSGLRQESDLGADRRDAQAQIKAALAISRAGGPLPKSESLADALSVLSKPSESLFSNRVDYQRDFFRTAADLTALSGIADSEISVAEKQLAALNSQLDLLQKSFDGETERLDALVSKAQAQIDAINGVDTSIQSVAAALASFKAAAGSYQQAGMGVSASSIATGLGKLPTQEAISAALAQAAVAGIGANDLVSAWNAANPSAQVSTESVVEWARKQGIKGYASGGMFGGGYRLVGENGPELEATGPSRIYNAEDTRRLFAALQPAIDLGPLLEEMRALHADMMAAYAAIARNTSRTAKQLERWDADGMPETTTA